MSVKQESFKMILTLHKLAWAFPTPKSHESSKESFLIANKIRLFVEIHSDLKRVKKEGSAQYSESLVALARFDNLTADGQLQVRIHTSEPGKAISFSTGFLNPSTQFVPCSDSFKLPLKSAFGELHVEVFISTGTAEVPKNEESFDWSSDEIANFTFVVDGTNFKVHKAVCIARSAEFRNIFFISKNNTAVIEGISKDDFKAFLNFIYASSLPLEFTNVRNMLVIARKFEVNVLVNICATRLRAKLSDATAEEAFFAAHDFECGNGLKEAAFKLIQARFAKINCKMPDSLVGKPEAVKDAIEKMKTIDDSEKALVNLKNALQESFNAEDV